MVDGGDTRREDVWVLRGCGLREGVNVLRGCEGVEGVCGVERVCGVWRECMYGEGEVVVGVHIIKRATSIERKISNELLLRGREIAYYY